jgi:hypothetical protein
MRGNLVWRECNAAGAGPWQPAPGASDSDLKRHRTAVFGPRSSTAVGGLFRARSTGWPVGAKRPGRRHRSDHSPLADAAGP